jgi:hypothetical protein
VEMQELYPYDSARRFPLLKPLSERCKATFNNPVVGISLVSIGFNRAFCPPLVP